MPRITQIADRKTSHLYRAQPLQEALEAMWQLLEGRAEDVFKMNALSEEVCVLDEELLEQLAMLEPEFFDKHFAAYEVHSIEEQKYIWENLPDYLLGTYTIRGRYTVGGTLLNNPRVTYYFSESF